ncbi:hypothetical protein [Anaerotalea alkaliphila]|uniref:Uncharacterized protein n=1 Tax=Anaerotalea alkaliphila TaxID=2662126 RepID=A0A7X5HVN8_9FIRM|nr:hypothetical protein [Anaerotalea alkaliphila]NDL67523.1 hypothetical protein [Anaerotalea alkaliphila]
MEDFLVLALTFLLVVGSGILKNRSAKRESTVSDAGKKPLPDPAGARATTEKVAVEADWRTNRTDAQARETPRRPDRKQAAPAAKKVRSSKPALKMRLDKSGLRQSILMAEVLGPPRGKRSHAQSKR